MIVQALLKLVLLFSFVNTVWAVPLAAKNEPLPVQSEESAYRRGLEKLVAGDLPGAEQAFRESQASLPKSASPLLGLAEIAFQRKQVDEAGALIRQAVENEPDNSYAQTSLGRFLRLKQQYQEAEQAFRKAADKDAKAIDPRMALGDLYLSQFEKYQEAANAYESVINIDPKRASAHFALGVAEAKLGNNERAVAELRKSGELEPNNPLPWLELTRVYLALQKPDDAFSSVSQAIKIDPGRIDGGLLRGDILLAKGDFAQAEKEYKGLVSQHKKSAAPVLHLAMLYQQQGKADAAIKSYQAAIAADSNLALAYNNIAWLLSSQKKNPAEAERMARKAVELSPQDAQFLDTLGWINRGNGKLDEARAALEKAAQLASEDVSIIAHLGIVLADSGEQEKAVEQLQKALSKGKNFPEATEAEALLNKLNGKR